MPAEQRASSEVSVPSLWQTVRNTDWHPILAEYQAYLTTIRQLANSNRSELHERPNRFHEVPR